MKIYYFVFAQIQNRHYSSMPVFTRSRCVNIKNDNKCHEEEEDPKSSRPRQKNENYIEIITKDLKHKGVRIHLVIEQNGRMREKKNVFKINSDPWTIRNEDKSFEESFLQHHYNTDVPYRYLQIRNNIAQSHGQNCFFFLKAVQEIGGVILISMILALTLILIIRSI
jgi:hypothetical protein